MTDFPIFGEVFSTDDAYVSPFVRDRGLPFTLDFPFQDVAAGIRCGHDERRALRDRFDDDDSTDAERPCSDAPDVPGEPRHGPAAFQIAQHGARD